MERIPRDVLEHHIFNHFSLNYQISRLITVCKLWKIIIESDTKTTKQLTLHYPLREASNIRLIQKYQPSILRINGQLPDLKYALSRLVGASKRLHTLILPLSSIEHGRIAKAKCYQQITTLALTEGNKQRKRYEWRIGDVMKLFPNLKRLQSDCKLAWDEAELLNQLDELTLFCTQHLPNGAKIPMVRVCEDGVVWEKRFNESKLTATDPLKNLSYEQYFRYLGQTKLYTVLERKDYQSAAKLLSTVTSMEYERYLHYDLQYGFPTYTRPRPNFSYDKYIQFIRSGDHKILDDAYHALIETKLMEVPQYIIFNTLAEKDSRSALKLLEKMSDDELIQSTLVASFCNILNDDNITSNYFNKGRLRAAAKVIVESKWFMSYLSSTTQFQKIWFLWTDCNLQRANSSDPQLFKAMINKGFYTTKDDILGIVEEWAVIGNQLMKCEFHLIRNNEHSPCLVKSNKLQKRTKLKSKSVGSLFNYLIRSDQAFGYLMLQNIKGIINHMDSSGMTPLISLIDSDSCDEATLKKMLKLGADPNLHHQSKHSPIVRLCLRNNMYKIDSDSIALLIEYGGDINAPCLFEKRMCSPLMIAVLEKLPERILWDMIAMGAKLDYTDVHGKTILDYAKAGYNGTIVKELSYFAK